MQGALSGGLKPSRLWRNRTPHPFLPPLGNSLEGCWWGIALVPRFRVGCCYVSILAETKAPCQTRTKTTLQSSSLRQNPYFVRMDDSSNLFPVLCYRDDVLVRDSVRRDIFFKILPAVDY